MKPAPRAHGHLPLLPPSRSFDEAALSHLTGTIGENLNLAWGGKSRRKKRKREVAGMVTASASASTVATENRSRKRKRFLPRGVSAKGSLPPNIQVATSSEQEPENDANSMLLGEIMALGGDEGDLALVGNIDSDLDDDVSVPRQVDGALRSELEAYAAELGLKDAGSYLSDDESETDFSGPANSGLAEEDAGIVTPLQSPGSYEKLVSHCLCFAPRSLLTSKLRCSNQDQIGTAPIL